VERLLAAGEVACTGVHGANRLASNSLLEAVVFADRAAGATERLLESGGRGPAPPLPAGRPAAESGSPEEWHAVRSEIGRVLWEGAGIVRDDAGLARAARRLERLAPRVPREPVDPAAAEVANLHLVGRLIVRSAIGRRESRGLHFTRSYPASDSAFRHDTVLNPERVQGAVP